MLMNILEQAILYLNEHLIMKIISEQQHTHEIVTRIFLLRLKSFLVFLGASRDWLIESNPYYNTIKKFVNTLDQIFRYFLLKNSD